MSEDSLRSVIDAIRSRLHEELETQLAQITTRHAEEVENVRRAVEADAEQRWSARVEEVRNEWAARLQSELSTVRADAEHRLVAESSRLPVEAEQVAAEKATTQQEELERALGETRARAEQQLAAERSWLEEQAAAERSKLEEQFAAERSRLEEDAALAEARLAERQSQLALVERMLNALRAMDASRSLSDVLGSLTSSAASEAPRVALFVLNGTDLRGWKSAGFSVEPASLRAGAADPGVLGEAIRSREPVVTSEADGVPAPAFAGLPPGRAAMAVPLLVGNQPVAVLYADDAADGTPAAPASWPEAIQILGRHASMTLAHLTAARAADAMRRSMAPSGGQKMANGAEDGNSARRYARLLVSEIKLYNEAAVHIGRQKRDLLARLKAEIDRARKLYSQRIPPAVDSRGALFQQELVQTLAGGDASLLGNPA